jgi:hypothetical protein
VGDGGLCEANLFNDLVDREPATATRAHNLLTGLISNGFGEEDGVRFHIDKLLWGHYIDKHLFVKSLLTSDSNCSITIHIMCVDCKGY